MRVFFMIQPIVQCQFHVYLISYFGEPTNRRWIMASFTIRINVPPMTLNLLRYASNSSIRFFFLYSQPQLSYLILLQLKCVRIFCDSCTTSNVHNDIFNTLPHASLIKFACVRHLLACVVVFHNNISFRGIIFFWFFWIRVRYLSFLIRSFMPVRLN